VALPTDELLAPRIEAAKKLDLRALPLGDGGFKVVQRLDWGDTNDLKLIYASSDDAKRACVPKTSSAPETDRSPPLKLMAPHVKRMVIANPLQMRAIAC
jgi:hypothetical protein